MLLTLLRFCAVHNRWKEWHIPCTNVDSRVPETRGFGERKHEGRRSTTAGSQHPKQRNARFSRIAKGKNCRARRGRAGAGGYVPGVLRRIEFPGTAGGE